MMWWEIESLVRRELVVWSKENPPQVGDCILKGGDLFPVREIQPCGSPWTKSGTYSDESWMGMTALRPINILEELKSKNEQFTGLLQEWIDMHNMASIPSQENIESMKEKTMHMLKENNENI